MDYSKINDMRFTDFSNISNIVRGTMLNTQFWSPVDNEECKILTKSFIRFKKNCANLRISDLTIGNASKTLSENICSLDSVGENITGYAKMGF